MYVGFNVINEQYRVWLPVHDPRTNSNWWAELYGTAAEIYRMGRRSAKFMDDAGFIVGWRESANYCGSIDYLILVREAVERCWWASFKMRWRMFFKMEWCISFKMA
jgi:hypothetical protein